MQNVEKELPGLIRELLQAPSHKQRQIIERHYTPDCRLNHALVVAENREEIICIFQYWRFVNRRLDVDVHEIVLSGDGRRAYCRLAQHVKPRWGWPLLRSSFVWDVILVLDLTQSPQGWVICGQDDVIPPSSLLRALPLLGWTYDSVARRAAALGISASVGAAGAAWRMASRAWVGLCIALGGTDAGPSPQNGQLNGPAEPASAPVPVSEAEGRRRSGPAAGSAREAGAVVPLLPLSSRST